MTKDTAKIITQKVGKVPADVSKVISAAISETLAENNIKVTDKTSENIIAAIKNYDRQAVKSKYNQVNTVMQYKAKKAYTKGVNDVAERFERIMQKELDNKQNYLDVLNKNTLAAIVGEKSRTQALHDTICQMCDKGIPAFVDAAGREWSPEAYVNMDIEDAKQLAADGYKWSGHTHSGEDFICMQPSDGDYAILGCFNQQNAVIYNSKGDFRTFEQRSE